MGEKKKREGEKRSENKKKKKEKKASSFFLFFVCFFFSSFLHDLLLHLSTPRKKKTPTMDAADLSATVRDFLSAFVTEVLAVRGLYSPDLFDRRRVLGFVAARRARHPGLAAYIDSAVGGRVVSDVFSAGRAASKRAGGEGEQREKEAERERGEEKRHAFLRGQSQLRRLVWSCSRRRRKTQTPPRERPRRLFRLSSLSWP